MIWYIYDMARYKREQETVRQLEREVDWLEGTSWRIDTQLQLSFDFELVLAARTISLTLRYGAAFPATPPTIFPRTPERLSDHQYGDADLCLEYGPDTWRSELTGADQIRSAHRLLSADTIPAATPVHSVPSRHSVSVGQATRTNKTRFVVTHRVAEALRNSTRGTVGTAKFAMRYDGFASVFFVTYLSLPGGEPWTDNELPARFVNPSSLDGGLAFGLPSGVELPAFDKRTELEEFLGAHGYVAPPDRNPRNFDLLLVFSDAQTRLIWINGEGDAWSLVTISAQPGQRLSVDHTSLAAMKVGLVGCGSVGSKIAVMLARAGVRHFVLVDDDVFLPENIVRNELTWMDVGQHKVDALSQRLEFVAPDVTHVGRKQRIGGQESNTVADGTLHLLRETDLIIDATANSSVFNLLSAAAASASKPMIWVEVFEGGIGGLIARSRPSLDPPAQTVRACIDAWCAEQGVPAPRPAGNYATETADGALLTADDADVSAIAAHAARYSIDLLLGRSPSWYPASAYVIGLSPAWLFQQPFVTFPIDLSEVPSPEPPASPVESDPETLNAIIKLIMERSDHASDPP